MSTTSIDESKLFIASSPQSLDDFLKTSISTHKHIYCTYHLEDLDFCQRRQLLKQGVKSISFHNAHTLYPPFR